MYGGIILQEKYQIEHYHKDDVKLHFEGRQIGRLNVLKSRNFSLTAANT